MFLFIYFFLKILRHNSFECFGVYSSELVLRYCLLLHFVAISVQIQKENKVVKESEKKQQVSFHSSLLRLKKALNFNQRRNGSDFVKFSKKNVMKLNFSKFDIAIVQIEFGLITCPLSLFLIQNSICYRYTELIHLGQIAIE